MTDNAIERAQSRSPAIALFVDRAADIEGALTNGVTLARLKSCLQSAIIRQPAINECTPQSIMEAVLLVAQSGCDASGHNNGVHFIPYKEKGVPKLKAIFGYNALLDLIYRSGDVGSIDAHAVYAEDDFDYELGTSPRISHKPAPGADRTARAVVYYCAALTRQGGAIVTVMTADEVDGIRKTSKQPAGQAWSPDARDQNNYNQMGIKTTVRRLSKKVVTNAQLARAIEATDDVDGLHDRYMNRQPALSQRVSHAMPDMDPEEIRQGLAEQGQSPGEPTPTDDPNDPLAGARRIVRD